MAEKKRRATRSPQRKADGSPRCSPDAEEAVLAAMLLDGASVDRARDLLDSSMFYATARQKTFEALLALRSRGQSIDLVTATDELRKRGDLESVGGPPAIARLLVDVPAAPGNLREHARIVRDDALSRRLGQLGRRLAQESGDPSRSVDQLLVSVEAEMTALRAGRESTKAGAEGKGEEIQGRQVDFPEVQPWGEPVDGDELFSEMERTIRRYMVLPELWIGLTYLSDVVDCLPRLLISSPVRACGKSRLLAIIGSLARKPLQASDTTPSVLFRIIEAHAPTLLLDEMDNAGLKEKPDLRAILNSGHSRASAAVLRSVGEEHEPRRFNTYTPIAFACIGYLPDTVASRCVVVEMRRRSKLEPVERLRETRLAAELEPLRRKLARWSADTSSRIREATPDVPTSLGDRPADNWTPLLAIADSLGGTWAANARAAACGAEASVDDEPAGVLILADIRDLFDQRGVDRLTSKDLLVALNELDARPWGDWKGKGLNARQLAYLVKPFGIDPQQVRIGPTTMKGYLRESFRDAFDRYLPSDSKQEKQAAIDADDLAGTSRNEGKHVSDLPTGLSTREDWGVSDVSFPEGEEAPAQEFLEADLSAPSRDDAGMTQRNSPREEVVT